MFTAEKANKVQADIAWLSVFFLIFR